MKATAQAKARTPRRRENPEVRRAQVLGAARICFARRGLEATTVDQIAVEAGVSVGLLYRFYRSKSAIIEAIIVEESEAQFAALAAAIDADAIGSIGAAQLAQSSVDQSAVDPDRVVLMFEVAATIHRNPDLRDFLRSRRAELRQSLIERLTAKGLDTAAAAAALDRLDTAGAIASGAALHAIVNGDAPLDQALAAIAPLMAAVLKAD